MRDLIDKRTQSLLTQCVVNLDMSPVNSKEILIKHFILLYLLFKKVYKNSRKMCELALGQFSYLIMENYGDK